MRNEYYEIYEMLYSDYIYENEYRRQRFFPYDESYIIRIIRNSIDLANKENSLRPDAKYFLIVNFHHLIVKPIFEGRPIRGFRTRKEYDKLEEYIKSDIITIVSETESNSNQQEISGHQIMQTIDKIWKNLQTTKFEIWG